MTPENVDGLRLIVFVVVVFGLIYAWSCWRHPFVRCETCKGGGKHRGMIWERAWRPCHVCNGSGRRRRIGAILIGRGDRGSRGSRFAPRTYPKKRR